jgi:DNA-binding NtrC family response regulator
MSTSRILIVEDEPVIRRQLAKLLYRAGYETVEAESVAQARERGLETYDLVIADLRLPGAEGTALIELAHPVPVLVMTSYASVRSAVESMQKGAADYVAKPFDHDEMLLTVRRILEQSLLTRQNAALKSDLRRDYPLEGMIGDCAPMRAVFDRVRRVAATDVTALILGESGTGKELVARAIHELGARRAGPFVAVNCAAIPESLIDAELFGHEKGAFTGALQRKQGLVEAANGGTLFLDEIGELAAATQARLLRALQEGEIRPVGSAHSRKVQFRLLAATHRDLPAMVAQGAFREDLYYRLRVMEITLPPLRERGDDLEQLAQHLLAKVAARLNRGTVDFSEAARTALSRYPWPGNVRELGNAIERALILSDGSRIEAEHLGLPTISAQGPGGRALSLEDYFRAFVLQNQGRMTESELARQLGISRKTLWERRTRMGLPRDKPS